MGDNINDITQSYYILSHKPVLYKCDIGKYKILQCGAAINNKFSNIVDNVGDNISEKNKYYLETTGIYFIWKNCSSDIKGHTQFRRFLSVNLDFAPIILEEYDIILASPTWFTTSNEIQYAGVANINDLCDCEKIIKEHFTEYAKSYDDVMKNSNVLYYSNSFIAKKEIYDGLCSFCFDVLNLFEQMHKFTCYDDVYDYEKKYFDHVKVNSKIFEMFTEIHPEMHDYIEYQSRVFGGLFERLMNVYIKKHNLKIYDSGKYISNMLS